MISGRWGPTQERQLQQFERSSEVLTPYETGGLSALALLAETEDTRERVRVVQEREARRAKQSRARQQAKVLKKAEHRLDAMLDRIGGW